MNELINSLFVLIVLVNIGVGFYCAFRMDKSYVLWFRLLVLSPALTSLYAIYQLANANYIASMVDVAIAIPSLAIYLMVASAFSNKPWLKECDRLFNCYRLSK